MLDATATTITQVADAAPPKQHKAKARKLAKDVAAVFVKGSWRNILPIHKAANNIPEADNDEKRRLAGDLQRHGLKVHIILVRVGGGTPQLLDGRHRLDLLEALGSKVVDANGGVLVAHDIIDVADDAEAERLSISLNAHREWRKLLFAQIIATPEKSNRQIAEMMKVSHPTVSKVRREAEATGNVLPVEKTIGADRKARKQPAKKAGVPQRLKHVCWQCRARAPVGEVQQHSYPAYKDADVWLHDSCVAAFEAREAAAATESKAAEAQPEAPIDRVEHQVAVLEDAWDAACKSARLYFLSRSDSVCETLAELGFGRREQSQDEVDRIVGARLRALIDKCNTDLAREHCPKREAMETYCEILSTLIDGEVVTEPADPEPLPAGVDVGMTDDAKKAGIPVFLQTQNRRPLLPEQKARLEEVTAKVVTDAAPRAAETAKAREEVKKDKARVRIEKLKAKKSGEAAKMPLVGKDAARFIAGAPK